MREAVKFVIILWGFAVVSLAAVGGCALLGNPIAEKVADVIDDYCKEPFAARQVYRDTVNRELAAQGHSISVTCAGDPTPTP